jgi:hypothetical protein
MYPDGEREHLFLPTMHCMYGLILMRDRATDRQQTEQNFIFFPTEMGRKKNQAIEEHVIQYLQGQ